MKGLGRITHTDIRLFTLPRKLKDLYNDNHASIETYRAHHDISPLRRLHEELPTRESDIYIATYPKNGTTWLIAMVDNLKRQVPERGLSLGDACASCPWDVWHASLDTWNKSLQFFETMEEPRVFKTHTPIDLIKRHGQTKLRVISIIRQPLDVFVSAWHHMRGKDMYYEYYGDFNQFMNELVYTDQAENGCWFKYYEELFEASDNGEISLLMCYYDKMFQDNGLSAIPEVARYLQIQDYDEQAIAEKSSFKTLKKIATTDGILMDDMTCSYIFSSDEVGTVASPTKAHIRKGGVGGWSEYFDEALLESWRRFASEKIKKYPRVTKFIGERTILGY